MFTAISIKFPIAASRVADPGGVNPEPAVKKKLVPDSTPQINGSGPNSGLIKFILILSLSVLKSI